jgi:hypothetical protein
LTGGGLILRSGGLILRSGGLILRSGGNVENIVETMLKNVESIFDFSYRYRFYLINTKK